MKQKGFLAFDLGTSGVKCAVFDTNGVLLGSAIGKYNTYFPQATMHEQAPEDWIEQIRLGCLSLDRVLSATEICAIGVSGHSLGALPVDADGRLLAERVPIWSDSRAVDQAKRFFERIDINEWYRLTGNGFPPELYSLFKIMWYKDNMPHIYNAASKFIGTKDYVNLFLTGVAATDVSYASGSGLYLLNECRYCEEYARVAGISTKKLPTIYQSSTVIGRVTSEAAIKLNIPAGIPVVAGGVDNACMTLGAGCISEGDSYASLGSSAWITVSSEKPVFDKERKIYTFAHCVPNMFIPSIGIFSSGSALSWAMENLFPDLCGNDRFDRLGELANKSVAGANGVMFDPSLAGGAAGDKNRNVRGGLMGLTLGSTRADIARAVLEGIAMQLYTSASPISDSLGNRLLLVGGGATGSFARQIYADVFGKEMAVSDVRQDAAALGAAALGAVGCGEWRSFEPIKTRHASMTVSVPDSQSHKTYLELFSIYKQLRDVCSDIGEAIANIHTV